jgi:elongation factor Ts
MEANAADVMKLRNRTGMQMMKCKAALIEAGGDMEKAVEILRKQNKEAQDKFGSREAAEGRIGVYIDPATKVGALVELRCESAPVAKNEMFVKLANDVARQIALKGATTTEELLAQPFVDNPSQTVNERIGEVVGLMRENVKPARMVKLNGLLGEYVHHDGTVGVLLQVEGDKAEPQLLRDVCMHVAAKSPLVAVAADLPKERVAKETDIASEQVKADPKNANKPANIVEKIVEGKVRAWMAENVLNDQPFVKDETKTIGQLLSGAGLKLVRFARLRVGEVAN